MLQSELFTKTKKEKPTGEISKNAQLLIQAGYVSKEMAGVYSYLPLGIRVIENIKQIVREEMNRISSQELLMTTLQRKELWESTNRWSDEKVDVWFKSKLHAGGEVGFGWSHEEPIGEMMKNYISSYRDMPVSVYQFQTKLRNELRAKSGVMRGREFVMKDMYSFCIDEDSHMSYYELTKDAYMRVYERLGIGQDTYITFADGGAFTKFSHEFQTICEAGEDKIFLSKDKKVAINSEVVNDEVLKQLGVSLSDLQEFPTAEVGNIFNFGQQKALDLNLFAKNVDGETVPLWMGSYGIGITRLMGVLVEKFSDESGIVWPKEVAPFSVHLVGLNLDNPEIKDWVDGIYAEFKKNNIEVLYDDRDLRAGEKFNDSDLIGIPFRLIVSKKCKGSGKFELVSRFDNSVTYLSEIELYNYFIK